jgi:5-methylcytosine-specific restriction protein A
VRFKRDLKYTEFYRSKEWDKVRKARLALDTGLCQKCKKEGKITIADMVHHKVEIKDDWDKRLDIDNLISLCNKCHNSIHKKSLKYNNCKYTPLW